MFYSFARELIVEVAGKEMPEFAINPMNMSAVGAVEELAAAAKFRSFHQEIIAYPFQMGTSKQTADGMTILAGAMLKELEANGDTGATTRFYDLVAKHVEAAGWTSSDGVSIPDNAAQLLILQNPVREEL